MTVVELRTRLLSIISSLLGTYQRPNGSDIAAVWVGEVPSDYKCTGLELRIEANPALEVDHLYQGAAIQDLYSIRLVQHGVSNPTYPAKAAIAIAQAFQTEQPTFIPQNTTLNILSQYTLTIRS